MLLCVSASHKTAPFELLERLSAHAAPLSPLISGGEPEIAGAVVLSTCNRFEAYLDVDLPAGASRSAALTATRDALERATGVGRDELSGAYEVKQGVKVAEHLFSVASGLESVVVGEGEIGGQVRRALDEARAHGTTTSELERLFQRATETQKSVKNTTALGRAGRSLVRLALDLADSRIADWSEIDVLLVGTGAYAAATLAALRDHGVRSVTVHSPSGRTQFAHKHGLRQVTGDEFAHAAARVDMVITCSSGEEPVLTADILRRGGFDGSAFVIDLGLPRNVDPDVGGVHGITLLDLETIRLHAPLEELQATDAAREIVQDAAAKFAQVGRQQTAQPAVVALRKHVFGVLESEIARGRNREGAEQIEQALRHFTGMLLHTPTVRAQEAAVDGRADEVFDAIETLFGIDARPHFVAAEPPAECPASADYRAS
ncbi:glutamyl-tRNA reductase [Microbacterium karelineae]|uniref:glutamyl-tRNA reductase n=1 Tax=Microbacterium karelineae TaxID=2654283 RepID=UPI0012E9B135|nr:glutamyl-tRNA reductase [Microbacterium karelineae]